MYIAQTLCPEGVWGPNLNNKVMKKVWGLRPYYLFALLLRNLGPQTSSGHRFRGILIIV